MKEATLKDYQLLMIERWSVSLYSGFSIYHYGCEPCSIGNLQVVITDNNSIDTYHIKMAAAEELRNALKLKRINEELLEHLASTLRWLLKYGEINNITLPEKDKIALA
jgi:hypothetical protein